jgi:DNA-directed RNA polymerase specialized sigma24 family protein
MGLPADLRETWANNLARWVEEVEPTDDVVLHEAAVANNCSEASALLMELVEIMAKRRAAAVRMLDGQGLSRAQIAVALNMSRQRVQQILNR